MKGRKLANTLLVKPNKILLPIYLTADIPHIIKYMGSKKPIINFITKAIDTVHVEGNWVCDLFSGSCSISAALRKRYNFISNDIQAYSEVLAKTYFSDLSMYDYDELEIQINDSAHIHVAWFKENYPVLFYDYSFVDSVQEYQKIELAQRSLFANETFNSDYHLFAKYYSGTYWSFEQCVWIDALRKTADNFINTPIYFAMLSSIMFAMSYTTQSTGHFAQYRDGNSEESVKNIIYYRQKNFFEFFTRKFKQLLGSLDNSLKKLDTKTLDFEKCLNSLPLGSTVYADPPYAPVHYSRFYHALETLVKYDFPKVDHKARYRTDRHQSPFSQKSKALEAFGTLFSGIIKRKAQLVLSYSGSGVVEISKIIDLANKKFDLDKYEITIEKLEYKHSTMGRFDDADRDVIEYLLIAKLK
ncbi:MAG: fokIM [Ferruginibacter sp.]|nr:fokIM [Ferruginibacter sp.]